MEYHLSLENARLTFPPPVRATMEMALQAAAGLAQEHTHVTIRDTDDALTVEEFIAAHGYIIKVETAGDAREGPPSHTEWEPAQLRCLEHSHITMRETTRHHN